jgi:DNA-binding CsgD family transcriptional regulator
VNHFDLLLDLGELRKSREVDDRILEWFPDDFYLVARRVDLELLSGDLAAAEVYLAKFISIIDKSAPGVGSPRRFIPYWKSAILFTLWSFFTGRDDLLGRAEESARFVLGSPDAARGGRWLALTGLAWVSMIRADAGMASRCYADLLELDNEYASRGAGRDMVLGMTAAIAGINEKAQYHLAIAWEEPDKGHSVITRVATGFHYGNFLMSHGNADAARPVIADAIREAERCEMLLWVEKLRSLRPGGSTDAPRHRSDGLTDREVEVLRLVAVGMTDKEIGSRLFISPKTVGNHVTHIREKTRTRNRVEIARYATERGLLTN